MIVEAEKAIIGWVEAIAAAASCCHSRASTWAASNQAKKTVIAPSSAL